MTGSSKWVPITGDMVNSDGSVVDKYDNLPNPDWVVWATCIGESGLVYVTEVALEHDGDDAECGYKYAWYYALTNKKITDRVVAWKDYEVPRPYVGAYW